MSWENYKRQISEKGKVPEEWYILGIDLGTTNSVVSFWDDFAKKPEPVDISNGFGKIPLPSVVQFRQDEESAEGEWVVGEEAYRSIKIYPESTIRSIKRKMGTNEKIPLGGKAYLPEELAAKILEELVKHCKSMNPKAEIAGLVVSVPYDFDDAARKATMRAVTLAGLQESLICLIEEPKAALLAYNFRHQLTQNERLCVFDFGGGTLDITIFAVAEQDGDRVKLRVISEGGEAYHGGDNIDELIAEKCFGFIKNRSGHDKEAISIENQTEVSLRAIETKERLSGVKSFRIPFTFCIPPFVENITRDAFEELIDEFIQKTRRLVLKAMRECYAGALTPENIDRVVLEGGSSKMPWVRDMLMGIFNDENKIYQSEQPAIDISLGATYYAAMKMGLLSQPEMEAERYSVEFESAVPHDVGLEITTGARKSFFTMIKRGTPYALAKRQNTFTLAGEHEEDMTKFDLRILERLDKDDSVESCKLIGDVKITGLPARPSGKTRLRITLAAEEDGGLIKGTVEDLGCEDFPASGFNQAFQPERHEEQVISS